MSMEPKLPFALLCIAALASACAPVKPLKTYENPIAIGDSTFCEVANNKSAYIGKKLTLKGTYITDFLHYSLLSATCDGKRVGFSLGYGPDVLNTKDPRIASYCKLSCRVEVEATVIGTLVSRDNGIDLDFTSMVLPEDLNKYNLTKPNNSFKRTAAPKYE